MRKQVLTQRWPWFLAAGLLIAVFVASTLSERRRTGNWDRRPLGSVAEIEQLRGRSDLNLLFIVVDTLRAERLGSYGYERDTSPLLDRLAASGVRFERHLGQSTWTKSSMASLWTGLYPAHTGVTRYDDVIPDAARMPAEVLREAGFQTFGLWRNGWVSPTFGFEQGFDVYQRPLATPLPPNVRRANPTLSEKGSDESMIDAGVEFARVNANQRWFLYLHMMDLHEYVYDAESALFGSTHSDLYDNSIRWTDGSIGLLLEKIAELGQLDRTLVAIVSDHGEAFLERGFEGHAREVFRETTEVPFLLFLPFRLDPGIVVKTRSQNVDVWPTLYDILGIAPPAPVDGRSLLPEILAGAKGEIPQDGKRTAIADLDQAWSQKDIEPMPAISVVEDEFRYVRFDQRDGSGRVELLFDAKNDPRELRDQSKEEPETFERLRAAADDYAKGEPAWGEAPTRQISELELSLLRALGYKVP